MAHLPGSFFHQTAKSPAPIPIVRLFLAACHLLKHGQAANTGPSESGFDLKINSNIQETLPSFHFSKQIHQLVRFNSSFQPGKINPPNGVIEENFVIQISYTDEVSS